MERERAWRVSIDVGVVVCSVDFGVASSVGEGGCGVDALVG